MKAKSCLYTLWPSRAAITVSAMALLLAFPPGFANGECIVGVTDKLDRSEANVLAVDMERSGERGYRFQVTLVHDDDGEDGYANWWQVEMLSGEQLGRRELLHAHGSTAFTRSKTISISDKATQVVVRGHDQTHGYGGQAVLLHLESGETEFVRQGAEPQSFEGQEP